MIARRGWAVASLIIAVSLGLSRPSRASAADWAQPGGIIFSGGDTSREARLDAPLREACGASVDTDDDALARPVGYAAIANDLAPATEDNSAPLWSAVSGWDAPTARPLRTAMEASQPVYEDWTLLPSGLLYRSYLAGEKEPRIGLSVLHDRVEGWLWEAALGGRVGILRHGTVGGANPRGWQIDLEGAALARLNPTMPSAPLEATDYRAGVLWTKRRGPVAIKAGYYHVSSHVGDEFLDLNPGFTRINYVRDSAIVGMMRDVTPDAQIYGEIGYALGVDGGAEPLEFQFGAQYVPIEDTGLRGAPFAAVNVHLREEVDFGGGINMLAGWRWRNADTGRLLRIGLQYYNGKAIQYAFLQQDQQLFGYGIWYDY